MADCLETNGNLVEKVTNKNSTNINNLNISVCNQDKTERNLIDSSILLNENHNSTR